MFRDRPFAPWPSFSPEEINAALTVLRSGKVNYWTGQEGRLFEEEFAAYHGRKYAVAVANGTLALELALYALGVGEGDEVIVPSRTFIATASCAVMRGAVPKCVDVDPVSGTLTIETVRQALSPRTKAIIAVHLAGWCCDMDPILKFAREAGIWVIEDCAQSHGARYKGRLAGSMSNVAAFSFCQDKIMTTGGEGGMLVTDDEEVFHRAWSFKDHGKSFTAAHEPTANRRFRWLHESFGTNWRLTEMQSAMGRVLLRKLQRDVDLRRRNADILNRYFLNIPSLRTTVPPDHIGHAYYKYYAFVRPEMLIEGWSRDRIIDAINAEGIPCFSGGCCEIYRERAFEHTEGNPKNLPVARELGENSLMFLVHPTLCEADMQDTCAVVGRVMSAASGGAQGRAVA